MQKITPHLWYAREAEEAAAFYVSVFPDSRIKRVTTLPTDSPSGPAGSVKMVEFDLFGQGFMAITAGPLDPFNHAVSFVVDCQDQAEIDRYWDAILEDGGQVEQCGWIKDPKLTLFASGLSRQCRRILRTNHDPCRVKATPATNQAQSYNKRALAGHLARQESTA
jgi:predicted 3-demethylubiquinone-9 3-methyltransferase (glyoxalase superfamily)